MFVFYVRQFYDTRIPYCMSHVFLLTRPFDVIMAKSEIIQMEMTDHIHWTQRVTTIQARPWRCQWCSRRYCHESSRRCLVWLQYLLGFRHPAALRMHLRISSSTTSLIIVDWPTEPEIEREKKWTLAILTTLLGNNLHQHFAGCCKTKHNHMQLMLMQLEWNGLRARTLCVHLFAYMNSEHWAPKRVDKEKAKMKRKLVAVNGAKKALTLFYEFRL